MTACPEPGIYHGIDFATYAAWPAMNASTLVEGLVSMRRLKAAIDGDLDKGDSDAMRFGRAVHCRLLEPDEFPTRFPEPDRCIATLKGRKKDDPPKGCSSRGRYMTAEGWYCGTHAPPDAYQPADYVTADEAARIEKVRTHAMTHREVKKLRLKGGAEVSIVFDLLGVRCKARLDKLIDAGPVIADVKTTGTPITDDSWSRSIHKLAYHVKAAWYIEAVKAVTGSDSNFYWIVIETNAPFDVAAIELQPGDRAIGRFEVRRLLDSYKRCMASGVWPGAYPTLVQHIGLPTWAAKEYQSINLGGDE